MECPKCQGENRETAKFCDECGHQLSATSTTVTQSLSFDEKIDKIQRYLPKGLSEKILAQRGKIEGENKQVTVMFCDMEGFTSLVEKLGPERAYSVMDEVYEILIHKVHDYEGTVNEMTGDGIMALFGAPIALEDAPQRALRSALAIHKEIANFNGNRKGIDPIKMRIGVHTGPVVVGTLGNDLRVEFKAVGDTVNLASRMEGLAEPGTTFLTEETFKLTEGLFTFEVLGERDVKGKEKTIPVYKLLSPKKDVHRPRLGVERSIYSEMVGRENELNELELQVMKAISGEGSIINIIGEAGIGKSRLIAQLKNCDVIKKVFFLEGRAISTGRNLSFHPIIDLLKKWASIGEDDTGTSALSKLEFAIRKVVPEDMHEILPFVATLMGLKLSGRYADRVKGIEGESLQKLILKNMRDLITKATELKPHVIVMEDLHWADTSSIELLESLFRLAETQRIVFINVFRPDYEETGNRIVETIKERYLSYYIETHIQPLNEQASETLINNMLQIKGLQHAIIDKIVERSDGNPFFIEEVVRSFIDHGAFVQKDGAFEVTEKIDKMVIPHTINDVLMSRIDRLDEQTRDLVKIASVIGRSFFYRILKEMTESIEDIDNKLSHLQDIQLFRERKRMEEIEYLFKHALAQEATYESILHKTRVELHYKVADSIESVFKERLHEFYGMLAYHYSKGEDFDKAENYMIKAGEEALGSSASSEALRYYQGALELYLKKYGERADTEKLAILEKNIAIALHNKGEMEEALVYFDRALKRWGVSPPKNKILVLLKFLFDLLMVTLNIYFPSKKAGKQPTPRDIEIFNVCFKKDSTLVVVDVMRSVTETTWAAKRILKFDFRQIENWYWILICVSGALPFLGLSRLSIKILDYAEGVINKNNPLERLCLLHFKLANEWFSRKNHNEDYCDKYMLDENLKYGWFFHVSLELFLYGWTNIFRGKFEVVSPLFKRLSEISEVYDYKMAKQFQLLIEIALFLYWRRLNNCWKSVEIWERLFSFGSDVPDTSTILFIGLKANLQFLCNDYNGAEKTLGLAEVIYKKKERKKLLTWSISYLTSRFLLDVEMLKNSIHSNNQADISNYRKEAYKSGKSLLKDSKIFQTICPYAINLMGHYNWLINNQKKAVKCWKQAMAEGKRLGTRPYLARTYMEIGKHFLEEKSKYKELDGISAEGYLEKARTMFQEMDLQWDLDELDKISMHH